MDTKLYNKIMSLKVASEAAPKGINYWVKGECTKRIIHPKPKKVVLNYCPSRSMANCKACMADCKWRLTDWD